MNYILSAFSSVFSPFGLLFNAMGVLLGIIFGALPGLNGVVGVALLLPLTYSMAPEYVIEESAGSSGIEGIIKFGSQRKVLIVTSLK